MSNNYENTCSSNKKILDKIVLLEQGSIPSAFAKGQLSLWPAVRIRLAFSLIERRYKIKRNKQLFKKSLRNLPKKILSINNKLQKSDVLFVSHPNYMCKVGDQTYDRVLEGHKINCKEKGEKYSVLNLETGTISYQDNDDTAKDLSLVFFFIKVYTYIYSRLFKKGAIEIDGAVGVINKELNKTFASHSITGLQIYQYLNYINFLTDFYGKLLRLLGVSRVYQATYYDPVGLSINAAASHLGIKTFCAQHGGQSKNNPAFGRWTNIPSNGYAMLPDVFLCWDEQSSDTILDWAAKNRNHTAKITGYHWPDLWRSGKIEYEKINVPDKLNMKKLNILYSMQPSIGLPPEIINEILNEFSNDVIWWFRLHPRQLKTQTEIDLRRLYADNYNIIISEATDSPLPSLMTLIDLHVTCFSSCIFEAMAFDIPTLLISKAGQEYFDDHIQLGKAKMCLDTDHLKREILKHIRDKKHINQNLL